MINHYRYEEADIRKIMSSIIIITDTREKKNQHILDWFDANGIKHIERKLEYGDYSFCVPEDKELGIMREMSFESKCVIERKGCPEELSLNFTKNRERFLDEFTRASICDRLYVLVEGCTYDDIQDGKYRSQYPAKSYVGSIHSFNQKFGAQFNFVKDKRHSGSFIYNTCLYYLREALKPTTANK